MRQENRKEMRLNRNQNEETIALSLRVLIFLILVPLHKAQISKNEGFFYRHLGQLSGEGFPGTPSMPEAVNCGRTERKTLPDMKQEFVLIRRFLKLLN